MIDDMWRETHNKLLHHTLSFIIKNPQIPGFLQVKWEPWTYLVLVDDVHDLFFEEFTEQIHRSLTRLFDDVDLGFFFWRHDVRHCSADVNLKKHTPIKTAKIICR